MAVAVAPVFDSEKKLGLAFHQYFGWRLGERGEHLLGGRPQSRSALARLSLTNKNNKSSASVSEAMAPFSCCRVVVFCYLYSQRAVLVCCIPDQPGERDG